MIRRLAQAVTLAAFAALSGCSENYGPANAQHSQIHMRNDPSDQLAALTPALRAIGLMRAIRQTHNSCHRVAAGAHQQSYQNLEMWVARCDDGKYYAIYIAPNADVQVRDCTDARQLHLPQCRPLPASAELPSLVPIGAGPLTNGTAAAPAPTPPLLPPAPHR